MQGRKNGHSEDLQHHAVSWYHHYLQHPGHIRLKETLLRKLPTKPSQTLDVLCVDLIGPDTIKGKDGTVIDFMCLTMIDPASSWFEIVELP
eukprot:CCRYP_010543-RA/>CCRYP_010543-RA protein AED:0.56 eAED:0.37 QI:0/0/0/1/0/0/2/0/90